MVPEQLLVVPNLLESCVVHLQEHPRYLRSVLRRHLVHPREDHVSPVRLVRRRPLHLLLRRPRNRPHHRLLPPSHRHLRHPRASPPRRPSSVHVALRQLLRVDQRRRRLVHPRAELRRRLHELAVALRLHLQLLLAHVLALPEGHEEHLPDPHLPVQRLDPARRVLLRRVQHEAEALRDAAFVHPHLRGDDLPVLGELLAEEIVIDALGEVLDVDVAPGGVRVHLLAPLQVLLVQLVAAHRLAQRFCDVELLGIFFVELFDDALGDERVLEVHEAEAGGDGVVHGEVDAGHLAVFLEEGEEGGFVGEEARVEVFDVDVCELGLAGVAGAARFEGADFDDPRGDFHVVHFFYRLSIIGFVRKKFDKNNF
ncbi:hypothetical protein MHBO_003789 [Bonamia ostreae]|uniref:Uncharacterized protein n=1 Tax=Bonamia ostreae TaxID=126728 RepID=A0ABV2ARJ0_9EUKA